MSLKIKNILISIDSFRNKEKKKERTDLSFK